MPRLPVRGLRGRRRSGGPRGFGGAREEARRRHIGNKRNMKLTVGFIPTEGCRGSARERHGGDQLGVVKALLASKPADLPVVDEPQPARGAGVSLRYKKKLGNLKRFEGFEVVPPALAGPQGPRVR